MQFRGEVKAYSLMGSYWEEQSLEHALMDAAVGGHVKVTCANWKALKEAWKRMEAYYAEMLVGWERTLDDRHVSVKSIYGGDRGTVTFSIEIIGE